MDSNGKHQPVRGFDTRAIHSSYNRMEHEGAICPPLHMSSTFAFEDAEAGARAFSGENDEHFYTRVSNPTLNILERRMADLEGAEAGLATASGIGAITSVLWSFLKAGDEVLADKTLYGCTFSFLEHGLSKFNVKVTYVDMTELETLREAMNDHVRIIFCESISNPNMRMLDIAALAEIAHSTENCRLVVDNTFMTPALLRPVELGADIVVHSATKYLGGHGDLIAGIAAGSVEDMQTVRFLGLKDMTGAVMSPQTAMLVMRGLKTLSLRMERHSSTANIIARKLKAHAAVTEVYYPQMVDHSAHDPLFETRQFGGVIAFEVVGGMRAGIQLMNKVRLIARAVSLGDAESLIQHPASMTHSPYTPDERVKHGISDDLVRLSVGLETPDDIWADLSMALDSLVTSVEVDVAV